MKENKDILRHLKEKAENIEIPESITPEQIRKKVEKLENEKKLEVEENSNKMKTMETGKVEKSGNEVQFDKDTLQRENSKAQNDKSRGKDLKKQRYHLPAFIAAAACLCLLVGTAFTQKSNIIKFWEGEILPKFTADNATQPAMTGSCFIGNNENNSGTENSIKDGEAIKEGSVEIAEESDLLASISYPEITYEDIYESMFGNLEELESYYGYRRELLEGASNGTGALAGAPASDGATGSLSGAPASDGAAGNIAFKQYAESEKLSAGELSDSAVSEMNAVKESVSEYGNTNVQTVGVDEGDVVKNDGRYLYQKIYQEKDNILTQAIQIVDTKDKLTEVRRIEGFESIQEFYIWEDTLVVIENKYLEKVQTGGYKEGELIMCGIEDFGRYSRYYHEITFYNIKDRSMPYKMKTFTLKGRYDSSRISDGYFYGFSKFYASPGEGETDYTAYVPELDGVRLDSSKILLPEDNKGNCYLVLVSIDLENPTKFTETTAIVTDSDMYYVSGDNIYIADGLGFEEATGQRSNRISLLRFSYGNGRFVLQAEGEVKGSLESSFSMDEYEGNLRMVTTVDEYWVESLKDDRTGEVIGTHVADSRRTNALYVLNQDLEIIGKIENLAKDEQIYSARFMGETGYFVTFRQTDPLFAVDLKDPKNPKILSELKISGFSEYLHFYGEDRLLGIGMEADEETGSTEGMKLSMFDISNPADVKEISKLPLSQYYDSEALYNHRAVLISVGANVFGFEVIGRENGNFKRDYLVFSYEEDKFIQKLKLKINNKYGDIYSSRGTFIGDVFYLLTRDGSVTSYNLNTGKLLENL